MLIVPAKNVTLLCDQVNAGQAQAEKYLMPEELNYVEVAVNIHTAFGGGSGTGTPVLGVSVWGSRDGVRWTTEVGPHLSSAIGVTKFAGQVATEFVSFFWSVGMTGGQPSDWGVVTFDVHANLKHL